MTHFTTPELSYAYDALAPAISEDIMQLHHDTHHVGYVKKLNDALAAANVELPEGESEEKTLETALRTLRDLPESVQAAVRNNGGGHYNHSLFWKWMTPGGSDLSDDLRRALDGRYGSLDAFKEQFTAAALGLFGSGWVWLQPDMSIVTTQNQDSPLTDTGVAPILGLDVWEHAYYLDYNAARKDYVDAWWSVVNWAYVSERLADQR